ncbi:isocyanide synthase family protein [Aspergillus clavatus NRRL 1]|uniref:Taurine catabolism dioxygenase TauD, TfdA family protein n=1 Tax=Aspergillus clavatus (strain ATCC 1007 / CBS 513.65 / DSM 816 / NCTC 3887 / NRRL 1 / QM 1276 / 107) TaxID=344612 RepID=A1CCG1_ASPCL|nr:taurine catabolism dioxygenase TauD, TfdA family protein [Aspergillus clavatus NRRL 1]EAW12218.1 taurine catabolism dioxygenase TauD, TfdA family protein [Aspergillus clavatus NRRL 1]
MPFAGELPSAIETQVSKILALIAAYRHRSPNVPDRFAQFVPELEKQLADTVSKKEPVRFVLPAFPFKAPVEGNKRKTLGSLPDKAEEIALKTLDGFADSIAEIYEAGATVVLVSDASVYGDLLNVADAEAFTYHQELQKLASSLGLEHLEFVRPGALAGIAPKDAHTLEEYSDHVNKTRNLLDGPLAQDVNPSEDENVQATSKHYDTALPTTDDPEAFKTAMLKRGKAYAKLIASSSETTIRLSIHESNNVGKITLDLFPPSTNPDFITPWHGAVAVLADASVRIVDASTVDMTKFEVITNAEGRPWLLREKSELFNWFGMELDFEPLFPCGMVVRPRNGYGPYKFEDVNMKQVRRLALSTAPLLLRGFTMEIEKEVFRQKARELGEIQMWPFGDILEVRENADFNMNNVLTREAMPFHYDGVFKTIQDEKTGEWISTPPLFQMFRNRAASQQKGGLTLFSSSRNLIPLLGPDSIPLDELRKLKWKTFTVVNEAFGGHELLLPFIASHPETGADTFRFHEPWPESKCISGSSEPTIVQVVGWPAAESDALCAKLTDLLYDRRVAYRHQWTAGDFIFNDNATTHHTRTAFENGHREHWRVHVS